MQAFVLQLYLKQEFDTGVSCEFCEIFKSSWSSWTFEVGFRGIFKTLSEGYSKHPKWSFLSLTIFVKNSILHVWQGFQHTSEFYETVLKNTNKYICWVPVNSNFGALGSHCRLLLHFRLKEDFEEHLPILKKLLFQYYLAVSQ